MKKRQMSIFLNSTEITPLKWSKEEGEKFPQETRQADDGKLTDTVVQMGTKPVGDRIFIK